MNPILQFPKRGRLLRRSVARRGPPAKILFFTGVRYERQAQMQGQGSTEATSVESFALVREGASTRRSRPRGKKSA